MKRNNPYILAAASVIFLVVGCTTPPEPIPTPKLNQPFLEGETTVRGSGVPNGTVEVIIDGIPEGTGKTSTTGNFAIEVPALTSQQMVTATQSIGDQKSSLSLPVVVKRATLSHIEVTPSPSILIEQGQTLSFRARGTFSNGTTESPLSGVTWSNEVQEVATIDDHGTMTGNEPGTTTVQAHRDDISSPITTVTVKPQSPLVTGSLKAGDTNISGTAQPSANIRIMLNGVPLRSSAQSDAQGQWRISELPPLNENDRVTTTQTVNGVQSARSTPLNVEPAVLTQIVIHPKSGTTLEQEQSLRLTASGTFSDGRKEKQLPHVEWEIQNQEVASIDSAGIVTSLVPGTTEIHAHRDDVHSGPIVLTVQPVPPVVTLPLRDGDTKVTGKSEPLASVQIAINGELQQEFAQANDQGMWNVEIPVPLSEQDKVTSTQVVNHIPSTASNPLIVGPAILTTITLQPIHSVTVDQGDAQRFTASGTYSNGKIEEYLADVSWYTEHPEVVLLDQSGSLIGLRPGEASIYAKRGEIQSRTTTVKVRPLPPTVTGTMKAGDTIVSGMAEPSASVQIAINEEAQPEIVQANEQGIWQVTPKNPLAENDEVTSIQIVNHIKSTASTSSVVGPAILTTITLQPSHSTVVNQGDIQPFTATGTFSDGNIKEPLPEVTWQTENPEVISVDPSGVITGVMPGEATLQARRGNIQSPKTTIRVKPLPPVVTGTMKAGDIIVSGTAEPFANVQVLRNGRRVGESVVADAEGQWQASSLASLKENDQVTTTQTINTVKSETSLSVAVLPNYPPSFEPINDRTVAVGETMRLQLTASDPDDDLVTIESVTDPLPPHSTWDPGKGLFTFTPETDQVGLTTLTFLASDGHSAQQETVNVKVVFPKNLFVLLENPDGTVGKIQVANEGGTQVLDKAGQAIRVASSQSPPSEPFLLKTEEIQELFKNALGSQPKDPLKYIVFFENDSTKLSDISIHQLPKILSTIKNREVPDISLIGHTDRTASDEYNHELSLRRANAIRSIIIAGGIDSQVVDVTGSGEHSPLVETPDDVSEPRNRRVEIILR